MYKDPHSLGGSVGSTKILGLLLSPLLFTALISVLDPAYAQTEFLDRRVIAWNLFYELMTAAFIVGAIVQGVIIFIVIRFREKKVKGKEVSG